MKLKKIISKIVPFVVVLTLIFLVSSLLFPEELGPIIRKIYNLGLPLPGGEKHSFTYTIPSSNLEEGEVVGYKSYAEDVDGNWAESETKTFKVQSKGITTTQIPTKKIITTSRPTTISSSTTKVASTSTTSTTIKKMEILEIEISNSNEAKVSSIERDKPFYINVTFQNKGIDQLNPRLIIQLKNLNGEVKDEINSLQTTLNSGQTNYLRSNYVALEDGYTIEAYVWSDWASNGGYPLAPVSTKSLPVS